LIITASNQGDCLKQIKDETEHTRRDTWQPLESLTPIPGLSDSVMRDSEGSSTREALDSPIFYSIEEDICSPMSS